MNDDMLVPLYTAEFIKTMLGPDNEGCDCIACMLVRDMKERICDTVTEADTRNWKEHNTQAVPAWMLVLTIAAGRAAAQGVPLRTIIRAAEHGAGHADASNPLFTRPTHGHA